MRPDRRMERLVLLPFTMGCVSESSVALAHHHHHHPIRRRSSSASTAAAPTATARSKSRRREMDDDEESLSSTDSSDSKSSTTSSSTSPSSKISARFHRILRTFKSTFVYKEEDEEEEEEMEIGVPTDVKHVTHIGWDDDVGAAAAAAVTSATITATTTTTTTRVNNPMDFEQHDQSGSSGSWGNNDNLITHSHYQPRHRRDLQQLMCHHHRRPSSYEGDIAIGALAAVDPVLPRRPLSVISPSSACT
ncbi:unnamed protein product [Linum trigynum]